MNMLLHDIAHADIRQDDTLRRPQHKDKNGELTRYDRVLALDAALKAADVEAVKVFTPPTTTNYAAVWLSGEQYTCEAAASAYAETVVAVGRRPRDDV